MKLKRNQVYPSKTTLNLVINERPAHYYRNLLITAVIVFALIGVFCKFAVIDRLNAASREWNITDAIKAEYDLLAIQNADYDEVRSEYDRYYANNAAKGTVVDSMEVLRIIDERLLSAASVRSVSLSSNTLNVVLSGIDLDGATRILTELYEYEELVKSVELYTATNPDGEESSIAMTIGLNPEGGLLNAES